MKCVSKLRHQHRHQHQAYTFRLGDVNLIQMHSQWFCCMFSMQFLHLRLPSKCSNWLRSSSSPPLCCRNTTSKKLWIETDTSPLPFGKIKTSCRRFWKVALYSRMSTIFNVEIHVGTKQMALNSYKCKHVMVTHIWYSTWFSHDVKPIFFLSLLVACTEKKSTKNKVIRYEVVSRIIPNNSFWSATDFLLFVLVFLFFLGFCWDNTSIFCYVSRIFGNSEKLFFFSSINSQ